MTKIFCRSPYNYDMDVASQESALTCNDESLAIQSERDECDINTIVKRFGLTGEMPSDIKMPVSGDFTGISDYHTAMNMIRASHEEFMRIPADIRSRFENDPAKLMMFLDDSSNLEEARKFGFLKPKEPEPVIPVSKPSDTV